MSQYSNNQFNFSNDPRNERMSDADAANLDYKDTDALRRMMTPNGKIYSRKRLGLNARNQRAVAQAIKRARFMALLPYTSATL